MMLAGVLLLALGVQVAPKPTVAVPAVDGVIDALRAHQLVAITDPHGSVALRDFLRLVFSDPRFADVTNDIVLEVGNARYQPLVDDYANGGAVDEAALSQAWQNTTVPNQISADVEWFRIIRRINATRPAARRVRILLGDPPIDWTTVRTRDDHAKWLAQRDSFPAALIQTEVLAKGRRALIVYGHLHFQRRNIATNFEMGDWRTETIVSLIERAGPTRVFTIWSLDQPLLAVLPEASAWPKPALARTDGTTLGAIDVGRLTTFPPRARIVNGRIEPLPREQYATLPIEQQLDAVLYLGAPPSAPIAPSAEPCRQPEFLEERLRRIAVTGIPKSEAEAIQKLCGAVQ
ncbi:MAG TPA: hypothetical protein VNT81_04850 [Vicinamibacterales bacterium]|nr:hypothetical protein [Vicinamibacterales bacterium]